VEEVGNKKNNNNENLAPSNVTNVKEHKQLLGGQQTPPRKIGESFWTGSWEAL
jgi:hypothetical protein